MTDQMRDAIDDGDVDYVRTTLLQDPEAARRAFWWSDAAGGGDNTAPIYYVSLARFHGRAEHDRMGEIARILLEAGASPEGPADAAETPVVTAASYGEVDVAATLVEAGADPVGRGFAAPGNTALAHAVFFGYPAVATVLIAAGAAVTTVMEAAGTGRFDARAVEAADADDRAWALRSAAVCEQIDVIDLLLGAGVPAGVKFRGSTALHWAAYFGKPASVERLIAGSADPAPTDDAEGATPLRWAHRRRDELFRPSPGHDAVVNYLDALSPT